MRGNVDAEHRYREEVIRRELIGKGLLVSAAPQALEASSAETHAAVFSSSKILGQHLRRVRLATFVEDVRKLPRRQPGIWGAGVLFHAADVTDAENGRLIFVHTGPRRRYRFADFPGRQLQP
ncbi:hypothetical protein CJ204_12155 [Corynebacterium xerosis]|uniref:Uncharacterized protein n=1 Tax=Corynebacterium xerosis TaxID=1725 RepID=A0A2N6SW02_9CORY|nr:hypothetical protein CJ204_12155 [Corynebacterium xerosis]